MCCTVDLHCRTAHPLTCSLTALLSQHVVPLSLFSFSFSADPSLASQDDNSARDAAVRHFLRQADGVLLVAACSRALNDKSIHALMPLSLRTALAERGTLGDIAIVATRADDFSRAELARNLGLPEQTVASELAAERRRFLQRSISAAFFRDLPAHVLPVNKREAAAAKAIADEVAKAAADLARAASVTTGTVLAPVTITDVTAVAAAATAAASRAPFELGVFVTSSTDYQQLIGVRDTDGDPSGLFVFAHPDQTDLPALAALLELRAHQAAADALARRAGVARAQRAGALLLESMREATATDEAAAGQAHNVDETPAPLAIPRGASAVAASLAVPPAARVVASAFGMPSAAPAAASALAVPAAAQVMTSALVAPPAVPAVASALAMRPAEPAVVSARAFPAATPAVACARAEPAASALVTASAAAPAVVCARPLLPAGSAVPSVQPALSVAPAELAEVSPVLASNGNRKRPLSPPPQQPPRPAPQPPQPPTPNTPSAAIPSSCIGGPSNAPQPSPVFQPPPVHAARQRSHMPKPASVEVIDLTDD
jgi:hypothetical protein